MKTLQESLFDRDLVSKKVYMYYPETKVELKSIMKKEIKKQGSDANLNIIDVSKIDDMSYLFSNFESDIRNIDISLWDVSRVKNMEGMFWGCTEFNCNLSKWNVGIVRDMYGMFYGCKCFTGDGLDKWDVRWVKDMYGMFFGCTTFNSDLSKWNVSRVEDMEYMFYGCKKFEGERLDKWNVNKVRVMDWMFKGCNSLKKIPDWYEE